ncbi:thiol-disulfide oxidoreductase DCC family protein [Litoribacillus peritrichatus]|uniref:thiol-disulfide oxidoreductase DCC family protein n=1 Tax=Litoribacillus peritrichatus TaxID=718191 RepID=UPI0031DC438A
MKGKIASERSIISLRGLKSMTMSLPPYMSENDKVILFDGVCKLCNFWSGFIIKHDTQNIFKLASVQSPEGQSILAYFNYPTDRFDTMLYIEGSKAYQQSDAFLNVVSQLGLPWKLFSVFKCLPAFIRNWGYDRIALNRYFLFGKYDHCILPSAEHQSRFLTGN